MCAVHVFHKTYPDLVEEIEMYRNLSADPVEKCKQMERCSVSHCLRSPAGRAVPRMVWWCLLALLQ